MKTLCRWRCCWAAALGLALTMLTGCQTWVAGMTLPSGHYLEHPPQYFPPSPEFPLTRELAQQQAVAAQPLPGAGAPVPGPGGLPGAGAPGVINPGGLAPLPGP